MLLQAFREKALLWSAFLFWGVGNTQAACEPPGPVLPVKVIKVVDGDTVRLADGRALRLIGVNTPEMNYGKGAPAPLAREARERVRALVPHISGMVPGTEPKDRYGRALGHLFLSDGRSVEELLLVEGLAYAITVPPNADLRECLQAAEAKARAQRRGLWIAPERAVLPVSDLQPGMSGFYLLRGRVSRIERSGSTRYLNLEERVAVRLLPDVVNALDAKRLEALVGRQVEVRGWLIERRNSGKYVRWLLPLLHPDHLVGSNL